MRALTVLAAAAVLLATVASAAHGDAVALEPPMWPASHGVDDDEEELAPLSQPHEAVHDALQAKLDELNSVFQPPRHPSALAEEALREVSKRRMAAQQVSQRCRSTAFTTALTQVSSDCREYFATTLAPSANDYAACASPCIASINTNLAAFKECANIRLTGVGDLLRLVHNCQHHRECFSQEYVAAMADINACRSQYLQHNGITNASDAAIALDRAFCSSGCANRTAAGLRRWWYCDSDFGDGTGPMRTAQLALFAERMCEQPAGASDICGVEIKAYGRLACVRQGLACEASWTWCRIASRSCVPEYTAERMAQLCESPCVRHLMPTMSPPYTSTYDSRAMQELCLRTGTGANAGYCVVAMGTALTRSSRPTNASMAEQCGGVNASCISRIWAIRARRELAWSRDTYSSAGNSCGSARCESELEYNLQGARRSLEYARGYCARNADGNYCLPLLNTLAREMRRQCTASYCTSASARSRCRALFAQYSANLGCCGQYAAMAGVYGIPPTTVRGTYARYNFTRSVRNTSAFSVTVGSGLRTFQHIVAVCAGNTSAFRAAFEGTCPLRLASPPRASLAVVVPWARLASDTTLKARMEAALQLDVAAAMAVPANRVNGSLVAAASSMRRQSVTASYSFTVDADTQAEADAAVASLNAQVAAGTLETPSTVEVAQDCGSECGSSPVQGAIPAPTPVPTLTPPATPSPPSTTVAVTTTYAAPQTSTPPPSTTSAPNATATTSVQPPPATSTSAVTSAAPASISRAQAVSTLLVAGLTALLLLLAPLR